MEKIKEEILEMLRKIEPLVDKIEIKGDKGEEMLENMKAYIEDAKHFLKNGDLVKSFESIIWAFAVMEVCKELEIFK